MELLKLLLHFNKLSINNILVIVFEIYRFCFKLRLRENKTKHKLQITLLLTFIQFKMPPVSLNECQVVKSSQTNLAVEVYVFSQTPSFPAEVYGLHISIFYLHVSLYILILINVFYY